MGIEAIRQAMEAAAIATQFLADLPDPKVSENVCDAFQYESQAAQVVNEALRDMLDASNSVYDIIEDPNMPYDPSNEAVVNQYMGLHNEYLMDRGVDPAEFNGSMMDLLDTAVAMVGEVEVLQKECENHFSEAINERINGNRDGGSVATIPPTVLKP